MLIRRFRTDEMLEQESTIGDGPEKPVAAVKTYTAADRITEDFDRTRTKIPEFLDPPTYGTPRKASPLYGLIR